MGNLLVTPITEKETHRGASDDGELSFAVSSMQGWRVHMEDAHIMEGQMYAEEKIEADADSGSESAMKKAKTTNEESSQEVKYNKIELPKHAFFAVFDGHGGSFAAEYAGKNFVRVLSRQAAFVEYANFLNELSHKNALLKGAHNHEQKAELAEGGVDDGDHELTPQEKAQINRKGRELLELALKNAFLDIDREIWREVQGLKNDDAILPPKKRKNHGDEENEDHHEEEEDEWQKHDSGTTATVVIFTPLWIICANAGDSRAVYSKQGNCTIPLSYDHKPDDDAEERRIYEAGGFVRGGRVEGDLAVSRGLGDFRFKQDDMYQAMGTDPVSFSQYDEVKSNGRKKDQTETNVVSPEDQKVSPMPDIVVQNRNSESDEFVVVACDGIFDVQTNHECIALVADIFRQGESDLGLACEEVLDICLEKGSKDNMTALIVKLPAQKIGEGGGVEERRRLRKEAEEEHEDDSA
jgi:serine/threonine protein phosphatase PrpC